MHRFLKLVHLLGLALFFGSILGHVVASVWGGPPGAANFVAARSEIVAATRALTLPGLGLALLSGFGMAALSAGLRRQRWMWAHAALALAIAASALLMVIPAGQHALAHAGDATSPELLVSLRVELIAGAANILLAVVVVALGVLKPSLRARASRASALRAHLS